MTISNETTTHCPSWCTATSADHAGVDASVSPMHQRDVSGDGWTLQVTALGDDAPDYFVVFRRGEGVSFAEARALHQALGDALAAGEGA